MRTIWLAASLAYTGTAVAAAAADTAADEAVIYANAFDCGNVNVNGTHYDLRPLGEQVAAVTMSHDTPPTVTNTTFAISLCRPLQKLSDIPDDEQCPDGTQICATETITKGDKTIVASVVVVAGDTSDQSEDNNVVTIDGGLQVEMHGAKDNNGVSQAAQIDFICDNKIEVGAPTLTSYVDGLLKLEWRTVYACGRPDDGGPHDGRPPPPPPPPGSGHWGFFTWFIILVFLLISAYIVFGAFVNYNRYGAAGWDLLPHAETMRDIPFLFKDYVRHIIDTFRGTRAGYSAV